MLWVSLVWDWLLEGAFVVDGGESLGAFDERLVPLFGYQTQRK